MSAPARAKAACRAGNMAALRHGVKVLTRAKMANGRRAIFAVDGVPGCVCFVIEGEAAQDRDRGLHVSNPESEGHRKRPWGILASLVQMMSLIITCPPCLARLGFADQRREIWRAGRTAIQPQGDNGISLPDRHQGGAGAYSGMSRSNSTPRRCRLMARPT